MNIFGGGSFGRWLGHEGKALMNGIRALMKKAPGSFLPFFSMWGHSDQKAIYEPGSGSAPATESGGTLRWLILDFPGYRTMGNKFLCVYATHSVYGILLLWPEQTKIVLPAPIPKGQWQGKVASGRILSCITREDPWAYGIHIFLLNNMIVRPWFQRETLSLSSGP